VIASGATDPLGESGDGTAEPRQDGDEEARQGPCRQGAALQGGNGRQQLVETRTQRGEVRVALRGACERRTERSNENLR